MRKKIHTLVIKLKPNESAMYKSTIGLNPVSALVVVWLPLSSAPMFATCVPAKAKNRNMVVPMNSPIDATKSRSTLSWSPMKSRTDKTYGL